MAIIWIIESADSKCSPLSEVLSANFPVRRIASMKSFVQLLAIDPIERHPSLVIVNDTVSSDPVSVLGFAHFLRSCDERFKVAIASHAAPAWQACAYNLNFKTIHFDQTNALLMLRTVDGLFAEVAKNIPTQSFTNNAIDLRLEIGDVIFDRAAGTLCVQGECKETLSPKEVKIFEALSNSLNQCLSRVALSEKVWPGVRVSNRTLDSHVSRLRRKIERSSECEIDAVYGEGYCLRIGPSVDR